MCLKPSDRFIVGLNNGWFNGAYGRDLWDSQYNGRLLWHYPHDAEVPYTLRAGGPAYPGITYPDDRPIGHPDVKMEDIEAYFKQVSGIDVVRIWLHEQLEGLIFDDKNRVSGVSIGLLDRLSFLMKIAERYNVKVYLCLLNAWDADYDKFAGPPARLPLYRAFVLGKRRVFNEYLSNPLNYCQNALQAILLRVKDSPALFAVDLMNEPEGLSTYDAGIAHIPERKVDNALAQVAGYAKVIAPDVKLSVGAMTKARAMRLSSIHSLDFSDYHAYNPSAVLEYYHPDDFNGKPCILGEVGYPQDRPDQYRRAYERSVALQFIANARLKGYSGALAWGVHDYVDVGNREQMIGNLKNLCKANLSILPPPRDPWRSFFSFFRWR